MRNIHIRKDNKDDDEDEDINDDDAIQTAIA